MGTTWLVVLAAISWISATTSGTEYVGCLFSEELCRQDTEWCFDDGAFGRCINNNDATTPEDLYRYGLDADQLSVLEAELDRLLETGYRWSHRHTQCVLQALLFAFQSGRDFEKVLCEHLKDKDLETALRSGNEELDPRNMAYIKYTPSIVDPQTDFADELYVPPKPEEEEEELEEVPYVVRRSLPERLHFSPLYNTPDHFRSGLEMRDVGSRFVDPGPEADEANDVNDNVAFNRGEYHPAGRPSLDHPYAALRNTLSLLQDNKDGVGEERGPGDAPEDLDPEQVGQYIKSVLRPTYFLFRKPTSISEPQSDQEDTEEEPVEEEQGGLVEVGGGYTEGGAVYQPEDEEELLLPELLDRLGFKRRERVDVKKPGPPYVPQLQDGETSDKKGNTDKAKNNTSGGQKETIADTPHIGNSGTQRRHSKSSSWSEKLRAEKKLAKEVDVHVSTPEYDVVDTDYAYIQFKESIRSWKEGEHIVNTVAKLLHVPQAAFSHARVDRNEVTFKVVQPNPWALNASEVARRVENLKEDVRQEIGVMITSTGIGDKTKLPSVLKLDGRSDHEVFVVGVVVIGVLAAVALSAGVLYLTRKHGHKLRTVAKGECEPMSKLYQDLCRARMSAKTPTQQETSSTVPAHRVTTSLSKESDKESPSSRSSTSSWSDEPALTNMDVTTGQMVLSYMEEHLKNKERLDSEWAALCAYEADPSATTIAQRPENLQKNRYPHALPYDHARVVLNELSNITGSDYINASTITDHDPRNPAYIVTQGPLPHTAPDLWQMVWEQGCVAMVMLTRLGEPDSPLCHHYWPPEGSELYHVYEVHLVSEHIWCDDYLVRSFYLKNLKTGETRTVTQFHFMSWPDGGVPSSTKPLLEFRRKVNKSFRGRSCPIVVHCSDGVGRSGAYVLLDMVLNRIAKGAKEIDVAATLEHIRDQRAGALTTKPQFQFVLQAVADEVHAILKILPPPTISASQ